MKKKKKKLRRKRVAAIQKKRTKENLARKKVRLDIRGLEDLKEKLRQTSEAPIKTLEKPGVSKVMIVGNDFSSSVFSFFDLADALKVNGLIPVELENKKGRA